MNTTPHVDSNKDEKVKPMIQDANDCEEKEASSAKSRRNVQFSCEICSRTLSCKISYTNHMKIHAGNKAFECSVCDKKFLLSKYLKQHMLKHTEYNPNKCHICGRKLSTKQALTKHVFRKHEHNGERSFACNVCDKTFIEKRDLDCHLLVHSDEKPYCCEHCGQRFRSKGNMDVHKRIHSGEKPYKCDVCDKSFVDKGACNSHRLIHTGEKPFKCTFCVKSFRVRHCLTAHLRKHTGERPYGCDQCEKTFKYRKDLVNHLNFHQGIKPYACKICKRTFYQHPNLISHEKRHSEKRPFICNICSKGFVTKQKLELHTRCHSRNRNDGQYSMVQHSYVLFAADASLENCADQKLVQNGNNILYKTLQAAEIIGSVGDQSCNTAPPQQLPQSISVPESEVSPGHVDQTCATIGSNLYVTIQENVLQRTHDAKTDDSVQSGTESTVTKHGEINAEDVSPDGSVILNPDRDDTKYSLVSHLRCDNEYFGDSQNVHKCSLCSCSFVRHKQLKEHLSVYHRIETVDDTPAVKQD